MLNSVKELAGYELAAIDGGEIGKVREVYFDDAHWVIRHLVVDTGGWLSGRHVLISPHAVKGIDPEQRRVGVALTRQQVQDAPGTETDRPVSRQYEAQAYDYYGYPYYWGGSGLWGMLDLPMGGAIGPLTTPLVDPGLDTATRRELAQVERGDPNLRSSQEVSGYDVAARDGAIGHVHDFLFDPKSWQIVLVVVDTHNWLPDRLVLVPPNWVDSVDWSGHRATFKVSRSAVEASPPYEPRRGVQADEVRHLQQHFEGMS